MRDIKLETSPIFWQEHVTDAWCERQSLRSPPNIHCWCRSHLKEFHGFWHIFQHACTFAFRRIDLLHKVSGLLQFQLWPCITMFLCLENHIRVIYEWAEILNIQRQETLKICALVTLAKLCFKEGWDFQENPGIKKVLRCKRPWNEES